MINNGLTYSLSFAGLSVVSFFVATGVASTSLDPSTAIIAMPLTVCGLFCILFNSCCD